MVGLQSQQPINLNTKFPSCLCHVPLCFRAGFAGEGSAAPLALLTATQPSCPRTAKTSAGLHIPPWVHQPWAVYGPDSHTHCSPWSPYPTFIRGKLRRCLGCRSGLGLGVRWLFRAHQLLWSEENSFETHLNEYTYHPGEVKAHCLEYLVGSPTSSHQALQAFQAGRGNLL